MKRNTSIREALDFDDVLLVPAETNVKPSDVSVKTQLTRTITLGMPLIAAGSEHVTESAMAITIARRGGIGVIHDAIPMGKQVEEVRKVKRAEGEMISNPITIAPNSSVAEAFDLMTTYKISGLPVIDQSSQKVVGIITHRDIRFFEDYARPVSDLMTKNVITVKNGIAKDAAKRLLHQHRIEKLIIVDDQDRCIGLMTVRDIETLSRYPGAARDASGRLRVGARVGIGKEGFERAVAMTDAGLDVVFVDMTHGHNKEVLGTVSRIRQQRSNDVQIVAGNVATAEAARSLIDAGADAVKVGIGASEESASRSLLGVGMPQMTAVVDIAEQCSLHGIPVIIDGGVSDAANFAKAIGAGASAAVIDALFSGTDEAPGHIVHHESKIYKMPEAGHHAHADPYQVGEDHMTPYRGSVVHMIDHLILGLKSAMAYTGSRDIASFHENATFVKKQK